jgi:hypothetical protein
MMIPLDIPGDMTNDHRDDTEHQRKSAFVASTLLASLTFFALSLPERMAFQKYNIIYPKWAIPKLSLETGPLFRISPKLCLDLHPLVLIAVSVCFSNLFPEDIDTMGVPSCIFPYPLHCPCPGAGVIQALLLSALCSPLPSGTLSRTLLDVISNMYSYFFFVCLLVARRTEGS